MKVSSILLITYIKYVSTIDPCSDGYPCAIGGFANALTPGNILVMRIGSTDGPDLRVGTNGVTDGIIGPTFMDEIDMMGALVQTLDLGSLTVPIRMTLFTGGTGPAEGLITTSFNKKYVIFGGYNMPVGWNILNGPPGGGLPTIGTNAQYRQSTWPDGVNFPPRIVARVGVDGKVHIIAQDYNAMLGDTLRSTCSFDGISAYMFGHATYPKDNEGYVLPDANIKSSPVMYYAGKGAVGVAILPNTLATSVDTFGNSRGCFISDTFSPGTPKLYVSVHTKYYFQWDTGRNIVSNKCACNTTNPAKVPCTVSQWTECSLPNMNIDRGIFEVITSDGKLPIGSNQASYVGLPGISADSRDLTREKMITSYQNYERYGNFQFVDINTLYISDATYNSGTNWYNAQTYNMNYAPGVHKFVKNTAGNWVFTERKGYSTSGETRTGGVIDGGYATTSLVIGKCSGQEYVFWASTDFQNAKSTANPPLASLGSRLRYYRDDTGAISNIASVSDLFSLSSSTINSMMWRGVQFVPCTDMSNTCPGTVNSNYVCNGSPSPTPSRSGSATPTQSTSISASTSPTVTPSGSYSATMSTTVSVSTSVTPTVSVSPTASWPSYSSTMSGSPSASPSGTVSTTVTVSSSVTTSPSPSPTVSGSGTPTVSTSGSGSVTVSTSGSGSSSPTPSRSGSATPTQSRSNSATASPSETVTISPTVTPSGSNSATVIVTISPSSSNSLSSYATSSSSFTTIASSSSVPSSTGTLSSIASFSAAGSSSGTLSSIASVTSTFSSMSTFSSVATFTSTASSSSTSSGSASSTATSTSTVTGTSTRSGTTTATRKPIDLESPSPSSRPIVNVAFSLGNVQLSLFTSNSDQSSTLSSLATAVSAAAGVQPSFVSIRRIRDMTFPLSPIVIWINPQHAGDVFPARRQLQGGSLSSTTGSVGVDVQINVQNVAAASSLSSTLASSSTKLAIDVYQSLVTQGSPLSSATISAKVEVFIVPTSSGDIGKTSDNSLTAYQASLATVVVIAVIAIGFMHYKHRKTSVVGVAPHEEEDKEVLKTRNDDIISSTRVLSESSLDNSTILRTPRSPVLIEFKFCAVCGYSFEKTEERFCPQCGTTRKTRTCSQGNSRDTSNCNIR
jgi:hypothetical protein